MASVSNDFNVRMKFKIPEVDPSELPCNLNFLFHNKADM